MRSSPVSRLNSSRGALVIRRRFESGREVWRQLHAWAVCCQKKATCLTVKLVAITTLLGTSHNLSFIRRFIVRCSKTKIEVFKYTPCSSSRGKIPPSPSGFDAEFWSSRLSDFGSALFSFNVSAFMSNSELSICNDSYGSRYSWVFIELRWRSVNKRLLADSTNKWEFRVTAGGQAHRLY